MANPTWWPPPGVEEQGQYLADMSEDDRRQTSVQIARSMVGIAPSTQLYRDLLYPGDKPLQQRLMAASQSGCSLGVGAWARMMGSSHPLLAPPYAGRNDAHSRIERIARDDEAWLGHDAEFELGDALMIGTDVPIDAPHRAKILAEWGSPGHAALVVDVSDDVVTTVDAGRTRIRITRRKIEREDSGRVWIREMDVKRYSNVRRVWGVISAARLKLDPMREWCLPRGPNYPGK